MRLLLILMACLPFTESQIKAVFKHGTREEQERMHQVLTHRFYTWQPRPDNHAKHEFQTSFVEDNTSSVAICLGGTGSGKTDAAAMKTARYLKRVKPHRERCPFWIIGELLDQVQNVCWNEKLSKMIDERDIHSVVWQKESLNRPYSVLLKHPDDPKKVGWVLVFKAYSQKMRSLKGESIGGFWCNEEVPFSLVIEIMGRCRDYNSPGWCDFTPVECKDQAWPDAYNKPPEGFKFYHLNTLENPYADPNWKRTFFATVPEDLWEMRTIGRFTSLAGQVYKEFRKDIHVVKPFEIPRDWKRIRAIDFGFGHTFVCLWIAFGFDGRAYVYDEYYRNQTLLRDHAREIHKRTWFPSDENPYYGQTYSDHDPQVRAELSRLGIHCTPANKEVNAGIEYVRGQMIVQANGHPRLYFFGKHPDEPDGAERCRNLIREIPAYHFDPKGRNNEPVKVDDDTVDALRYGLYTSRIVPMSGGANGWRSTVDGRKYGVMAIRGGR